MLRTLSPSIRIAGILVIALASIPTTLMAAAPKNKEPIACRVNGAAISSRDVEAEKSKKLPWSSFHGNVDAEQQQQLRRDALQTLIDEELKYQDAIRRSVKVSKKELAGALDVVISKYPNEEAFQARLKAAGIPQTEIEEALRRQEMVKKVEVLVADSTPEISMEQTKRYYTDNAKVFERPQQAVVRQLFIRMPPLKRDPADWKAAIERAELAREQISAGEPFETLVEEMSDAPGAEVQKGGLIGTIHPGQLETALDNAIWPLPEGGVSEPVRTFEGVYLLKVDKFISSRQLTFEEISERVQNLLQKNARERQVEEWLSQLHAEAEIEVLDPSLLPPTESSSNSQEKDASPQ